MPTFEQWFWVAILVIAALVPVARQYWKNRKVKPPYCAQNDRKAFRLWQTDPQAYARKYGELDRKLQPPGTPGAASQTDDSDSSSSK